MFSWLLCVRIKGVSSLDLDLQILLFGGRLDQQITSHLLQTVNTGFFKPWPQSFLYEFFTGYETVTFSYVGHTEASVLNWD